MTRNIPIIASRNRRKKVLKSVKGFRGNHHSVYRNARESLNRARRYSYIGRKIKKRDFRSLWITRLNAASRSHGMTYSRFIYGLKKAQIELNRKELSEMAIHHPNDFEKVISLAQAQIKN